MAIHIPELYLTAEQKINDIFAPLAKYGLRYFSYFKNFPDNSQIYFSNSSEWLWDYYHLELFNTSLFEHHPKKYKSGCYLWPSESSLPIFTHGIKLLDSNNGITFVESDKLATDFYCFSGLTTDIWLNNFYINHIDLFKKFISYFKSEFKPLFNKAALQRIQIPHHYQNTLESDELKQILLPEYFNASLPETFITPHTETVQLSCPELSARELEIVQCLILGRTAKETAKSLYISYRTVEKHLENIKEKLLCRNKSDIVSKIFSLLPTSLYNIRHQID